MKGLSRKIALATLQLCLVLCFSYVPSHPKNRSFQKHNQKIECQTGKQTRIYTTTDSGLDQGSTQEHSRTNFDLVSRVESLSQALLTFNSSAASDLINGISSMKNNGTAQETIDLYLNGLLSNGPDRALPVWSKMSIFCRISRNARLASLRRTLDMTTPPPNMEDEQNDSTEDQQRRRRRALVSLLRTLAAPSQENVQGSAIRFIEKKCMQEQRAGGKVEDLLSRRPPDLETPQYDVVMRGSNGFEIRRYEPFAVCTVDMGKPRPLDAYKTDATVSDPKMGGARAFGALAGYLFGKNQENRSMKMTTPVLTDGSDDNKQMSFILPSDFWNDNGLSLAPKPLVSSGVMLQRNDGGERAVIMFGGYASKSVVATKKQQLLDSLRRNKGWVVDDVNAHVALAQYNDPFTPPWKRLNEVSIAVKQTQEEAS